MPGILVVSDCAVDEIFIKTLENASNNKAEIFFIDTTDARRKRRFIRHVIYLFMAIKTFMYANDYETIIFWQQFIGFYYGIIAKCVFWKRKPPHSIVLQLIYKTRKGLPGRIYKICFDLMLKIGAIDKYICHSASEMEFYRVEFGLTDTERFGVVKLGVGMPDHKYADSACGGEERYFFAGGTSNRDYRTLLDAFKDMNENLRISCFPKDLNGLSVPRNVRVLYGVYRDDFLDCMRKAYAVIITIDDIRISTGQLVLLDAMRLGKAIIATRCYSMADYVDESCAIFVKPHSSNDLKAAVKYLLNNKNALDNLANEARKRYESNFTIKDYAKRIACTLNQIRQ